MLSFEEAQRLIASSVPAPQEEELFVPSALGRITSRELVSPVSLPVFDNSAMDGFALCSGDTADATPEKPILFSIRGVVRAGDSAAPTVDRKDAYRIMTGSPIPKGADTVLAKEKAFLQDQSQSKGGRKQVALLAIPGPLPAGQNIRMRGEEIQKGVPVLPKGSMINPGTVGFLAALGVERIHVYRAPRVAIVTTGSELIPPGRPLRPGQIYDSNTSMIRAALEDMRLRPTGIRRVADRADTIRQAVAASLKNCDILILMGGVSVGDFDYGKQALAARGVETVFWKVRQKPGKPLFFGKKGHQLVFGLPGNPASVFTCFYEYVYPAIRRMMGHPRPYLPAERIELGQPVVPDGDKTLFIKARVDWRSEGKCVMPLKNQKSHMLSSFCEADSFLMVPGSDRALEKGDTVEVHTLPYAAGAEAGR